MTRSTSTATFGPSCREIALIVTARTPSSGRPICDWTSRRALRRSRRSRGLRCRQAERRAKPCGGCAPTMPTSRCRLRRPERNQPPRQIELIRQWISQGAKWSEHWSYVPPTRPSVPKIRERERSRNAIDRFILARLEQENLRSSPEADRVTLLRRLSLDLIGLPPTLAEVDAFLADKSPDAYERQVDRLLASPHYGERWGASGSTPPAMPIPTATRRTSRGKSGSIATGSSTPSIATCPTTSSSSIRSPATCCRTPTQDQIVATGFLRNSMLNEEGGVDPEQFRMEAMFDRMDAIGKSMLGLTIQCAQCHNHKYDPLTQEEYYRMFAFLNNDNEANIAVYTPDEQRRRADIFRQIHEIEAGPAAPAAPTGKQRMAKLGRAGPRRSARMDRRAAEPRRSRLTGGQKHYLLADGSIPCQGYAPTKNHRRIQSQNDSRRTSRRFGSSCSTIRICRSADRDARSRERARLTEFAVTSRSGRRLSEVDLGEDGACHSRRQSAGTPLEAIFDDKSGQAPRDWSDRISRSITSDETAWGIDNGPHRRNQPRKAVFVAEKPISFPAGTVLTFALSQNHGGWNSDDNQNNNLGRFRLSVTTAPDPTADPLPQNVRQLLAVPPDQAHAGASGRRSSAIGGRRFPNGKRPTMRSNRSGSSIPKARRSSCSVRQEIGRTTRMLKRGDFLKPERTVSPGVPRFLHQLPADAPAHAADLRAVAGRSPIAHDRAGHRQSRLAGLFRHRHGRHERRLGLAVRNAVAPAAARLAGRRVHGSRLEPEVAASADS